MQLLCMEWIWCTEKGGHLASLLSVGFVVRLAFHLLLLDWPACCYSIWDCSIQDTAVLSGGNEEERICDCPVSTARAAMTFAPRRWRRTPSTACAHLAAELAQTLLATTARHGLAQRASGVGTWRGVALV
ncbi:hypothetical protein SETIT_4G267300v2 [Setaria italica]|uniref:Uncharacterized protein n=1 Tax=Setaria italica TaxID=4555 RepID=A0A368QYQ3_SETIT|nr:hypothetical protein SETIT_4G267300v2 [Setaria italica]